MQRNTRNTRNPAKPFVSGGVISNFSGDKPTENLPASTVSNRKKKNLFIYSINQPPLIEHGAHEKSAYSRSFTCPDGASSLRFIYSVLPISH